MSAADGRVVGTTQIVNNGPAERRWNLVLMGDGYLQSELGRFQADVMGFVGILRATPPFDVLWPAVNVFQVNVESVQSGADDPATCADGTTGSGARVRTFFDAAFCSFGSRRLLTVNERLALQTARRQVPRNHASMVVVNSPLYGGSGGGVAVFSTAPQAFEIAIHELGHSFFRLADEYPTLLGCESGETGHDRYTGGEPREPNVTRETSPGRIKWKNRIAGGTPVPTTRNADCTRCDPQPSPAKPGTVGLFEGARYFHCGLFRPEFDCKMRTLGQPFCAVCSDEIIRQMRPFMP